MTVSWLPDQELDTLRAALRQLAPDLADQPIKYQHRVVTSDTRYYQNSAVVDDAVLVKFAWSEVPARRIGHEAAILRVLAEHPLPVPVPELLFSSTQPALLATRWVSGGEPVAPWDVDGLDPARRQRLATDLGGLFAALHRDDTLTAVRAAGIALATPSPQADTDALRTRFLRHVPPDRRSLVRDWCDWTDAVLAAPADHDVLLHADLHGFNLVWDRATGGLRLVADWETAAIGDPAYDFRYLPKEAATVDHFRAVVAAYEAAGGRPVHVPRVMAWHLRTVLGDALWRSDAGIGLPGGGTVASWLDEMAERMRQLV